YAGAELHKLPGQVSWTTRLRKDAALYELAPPRTGRRGRPPKNGKKLAKLADLAPTATVTPTPAHRYRHTATVPPATSNAPLDASCYATAGPHRADLTEHRTRRPWYRTKTNPSPADMLAKLRRVLIAARFRLARPERPSLEEIQTIRLAWEDPAA